MDANASTTSTFSTVGVDTIMQHVLEQDAGQFYTLVKMHLSFLLNFTIDEVDAPVIVEDKSNDSGRKILPFTTKTKNKLKASGSDSGSVVLSHEGVCQAYQLIEFLSREDNLIHEGLFRKTGNLVRQQELKQCLISGSSIDFESGLYSAHDCASVLKSFLASLSEPLLTKALYPAHCQVADLCPADAPADALCAAHNKQIKALQLLFLLVPAENYQLLKDLLHLLYKVSLHHAKNKMTTLNLGTMFAPHILCPRKMPAAELQMSSGSMAQAVALMIENTPLLFKVPHELEIDLRAFVDHQPGTPGLDRRCRRHSCSDVDSPQANTVFSFVDRERSAAAGVSTDTDTALAGLYAHISSMPDSARRRKLIKQFNRQSGSGTPTVARRVRTRSFGESLRKHLLFGAGRPRKPAKGDLTRRSCSDEALASPPSPETKPCYRQRDADDVAGWAEPPIKRSLLTPTAAAHFTPKLARSLRQVQREGVPCAGGAVPLPGSARRSSRTAEMSTFRTGRNNSMRRGQVPLRPVRADVPMPTAAPKSPITRKLDAMSSSTRVHMLTPGNRRAVCLTSQTSLSAACGVGPLSPVLVLPLQGSPSRPKRLCQEASLSSPFRQYLLHHDMLAAESAVAVPDATARLLSAEVELSDSLMDCMDGVDPVTAGTAPADISATVGTAPTDISATVGTSLADTSATVGTSPADISATVGTSPADISATVGTASADISATVGISPADISATMGTASADVSATVGTASADISATVGIAPADIPTMADTSSPADTLTAGAASPQPGTPTAATPTTPVATLCPSGTTAAPGGTTAGPAETPSLARTMVGPDEGPEHQMKQTPVESGGLEDVQAAVTSETHAEPAADLCVSGCKSRRSRAGCPPSTLLAPGSPVASRSPLTDLNSRPAGAAEQTHLSCGLLPLPEKWADAGAALPTVPPGDGDENQRRKTLTDRDTNPMAHRKIGAPRKQRSVLFETDL